MHGLIWFGPWRVENTCLTKRRFLSNLYSWKRFTCSISLVFPVLLQPFPSFSSVKWQFVNELVRVAAPGATIIIVTWCHRDLTATEDSLQPWEKELLDKICGAYYLPSWCSADDYVKIFQSLPVEVITGNLTCAQVQGNDELSGNGGSVFLNMQRTVGFV